MVLGGMYAAGRGVARDDAEAVKWLRKAAEQGNARVQAFLGEIYFECRSVAQNIGEAMKWYHKSAIQGNAVGQWRLGRMYAAGRGVARDDVELPGFDKAAKRPYPGNEGNIMGEDGGIPWYSDIVEIIKKNKVGR